MALTVVDAAKRIGVSPSMVYQLAAARRVAHFRVGGKILFAEADIDAFLQSCRVGTVTAAPRTPQPSPPRLKHLALGKLAVGRPPAKG